MAIVIIVVCVIAFMFLVSAVKIVQEYERGVIFRLGRIQGAKGPGLFLIVPIIDKMQRIDLRTITLEVPPQEVITRDNVTVKVTAVVFFRIVNPNDAVIKVVDFMRATSQISQTTLRSALGQADLDQLLSHREQLNQQIQQIIDENTEPWGIKVSSVEIKDVELPQTMQRAMARQAEAEREKRAKIISAEGEFQASQQLEREQAGRHRRRVLNPRARAVARRRRAIPRAVEERLDDVDGQREHDRGVLLDRDLHQRLQVAQLERALLL